MNLTTQRLIQLGLIERRGEGVGGGGMHRR